MTGPKTNERPGIRARAAYVRTSPYKVRAVLDLIRGKGCGEAHEILAFCERDAAVPVSKVLHSAVANAEHNEGFTADELYVSACYVDEGPTLKRWRPRARGRATRIRKRTSHITVIVSRYDETQLERQRVRRSRVARAGSAVESAESRRRRVAQSRRQQRQTQERDVATEAAAVVQATEEAMADSDSDNRKKR